MRATLPAPSENCEGNSMIERAVKREIDTCASLSSDANRLVTLCVCVCVCGRAANDVGFVSYSV